MSTKFIVETMEIMIMDTITYLKNKKKRPSVEAIYEKLTKDDTNINDGEFIATFKILEGKNVITNIKPNDNYGSYRICEKVLDKSYMEQLEEEVVNNQLKENKYINLLKDLIEFLKVEIELKNNTIQVLLEALRINTSESENAINKHNITEEKDHVKENNVNDGVTIITSQLKTKQQSLENIQQNNMDEEHRNNIGEILNKQLTEVRKEKHRKFLEELYPNENMDDNDNNEFIEVNRAKEKHHWKSGTVLIAGDSIVSGIMEKRMGSNVKVRAFPGASIKDMSSYLIPLLEKKPDHIILHVSTNNSVNEDADAITDELLQLKHYIEKSLTETTVILSLPTIRMDNQQANNTVIKLCENLTNLNINIINNSNISKDHLGKAGLHLNAKGLSRLAMNFISYIRRV